MCKRICFALAPFIIALACLTTGAFIAHGADTPKQRTCFPARLWSAKQAYRPCARVTKVEEDGSITVAVSDADGTVRYTASYGAVGR